MSQHGHEHRSSRVALKSNVHETKVTVDADDDDDDGGDNDDDDDDDGAVAQI